MMQYDTLKMTDGILSLLLCETVLYIGNRFNYASVAWITKIMLNIKLLWEKPNVYLPDSKFVI